MVKILEHPEILQTDFLKALSGLLSGKTPVLPMHQLNISSTLTGMEEFKLRYFNLPETPSLVAVKGGTSWDQRRVLFETRRLGSLGGNTFERSQAISQAEQVIRQSVMIFTVVG